MSALRLSSEQADRLARIGVVVAAAISALLLLILTRDTSFSYDDLNRFATTPQFGLHEAFRPYNGNLVLSAHVAFKLVLGVFGAEFLVFRLLGIAIVLAVAGLFFEFARRRVGDALAAAPTILLLFLGSAWPALLQPAMALTMPLAIAFGLAALLALDRADRRGDIAAALLLCLAVVTFTIGLAFVIGVALLIALGEDRRRRWWIAALPLAIWAVWAIAAHGEVNSPTSVLDLGDVLLIPSWAADSLATGFAGLSGLDFSLVGPEAPLTIDPDWGRVLAVLAAAVFAWRARRIRGRTPASAWALLAIPLAYWAGTALVSDSILGSRLPTETRYVFPAAVGLLIAAAEAARGVRAGPRALIAVYAVTAIFLITNVVLLVRAGDSLRTDTTPLLRAQVTALTQTGGQADPAFDPRALAGAGVAPTLSTAWDGLAAEGQVALPAFLGAVSSYDFPTYSDAQLSEQSEPIRKQVDQIEAAALGVGLTPSDVQPKPGTCLIQPHSPKGVTSFGVPAGGLLLTLESKQPAELRMRRFGDTFPVNAGTLQPGRQAQLHLPADSSTATWFARVPAPRVRICLPR